MLHEVPKTGIVNPFSAVNERGCGPFYDLIQFAAQFVSVICSHGVDFFPLVLNQSNATKKQSEYIARKIRTVHSLCLLLAGAMNPTTSGMGFDFENPRAPIDCKLIVAGGFSVVNGEAVN